jgi:hypothetical protein
MWFIYIITAGLEALLGPRRAIAGRLATFAKNGRVACCSALREACAWR